MNQFIQKNKKIIAGIASCLLVAGVTMSFQNSAFGPIDKLDTLTDLQDTIPVPKKNADEKINIKDYDLLLQNMDHELINVQKEIPTIDFNNIYQEINTSLTRLDIDKIKIEIDKSMKEIDFAKIEEGVKTALKEIDWTTINKEVKISLQDAKKEIDKIDMDVIKKELENARVEIEKTTNEIKKINIEKIMKNANEGFAKSKEELRLTKDMFNEMEKDGLISQKEGFTIEYKDKELMINGKKQTESITNKYKHYIKGDLFKISISKE